LKLAVGKGKKRNNIFKDTGKQGTHAYSAKRRQKVRYEKEKGEGNTSSITKKY